MALFIKRITDAAHSQGTYPQWQLAHSSQHVPITSAYMHMYKKQTKCQWQSVSLTRDILLKWTRPNWYRQLASLSASILVFCAKLGLALRLTLGQMLSDATLVLLVAMSFKEHLTVTMVTCRSQDTPWQKGCGYHGHVSSERSKSTNLLTNLWEMIVVVQNIFRSSESPF